MSDVPAAPPLTVAAGRSRGWTGSMFDYDDVYESLCEALAAAVSDQRVTRAILGKEVCPTTQRKHLQWYVEFGNAVQRGSVTNLGITGHTEHRLGSPAQCWQYCSKDGDFATFGSPPKGQGKRSDLDQAIETLTSEGLEATAMEHPAAFVKYGRGLAALEARFTRPFPLPQPTSPPRYVTPVRVRLAEYPQEEETPPPTPRRHGGSGRGCPVGPDGNWEIPYGVPGGIGSVCMGTRDGSMV